MIPVEPSASRELPFQDHDVEPVVTEMADAVLCAHDAESKTLMKSDAIRIRCNHFGDEMTVALITGLLDQCLEECAADSTPLCGAMDIDRGLSRCVISSTG